MRSGGGLSRLLLAAVLGAGPVWAAYPTPSSRPACKLPGRHIGEFNYPTGPGWSNRQVKRMATKRRNQARNKKSHRG